jgi:hypothetical protein
MSLCRCPHPSSHGDAFTRYTFTYNLRGYFVLTSGTSSPPYAHISWEDAMHALLDNLGKDFATIADQQRVIHLVFDYHTCQRLRKKWKLLHGPKASKVKVWIEADVKWWSEVNRWGWEVRELKDIKPTKEMAQLLEMIEKDYPR